MRVTPCDKRGQAESAFLVVTILPDFLADLAPPASIEPGARSYGPAGLERSRPYRGIRDCLACGARFPLPLGRGRPPRYCRFDRSVKVRVRVYRRARAIFVTRADGVSSIQPIYPDGAGLEGRSVA